MFKGLLFLIQKYTLPSSSSEVSAKDIITDKGKEKSDIYYKN
jgi:hypothetical protein